MECPTCNGIFEVGDSYMLDAKGKPIRCIHLHFVEPQPDPVLAELIDQVFNI